MSVPHVKRATARRPVLAHLSRLMGEAPCTQVDGIALVSLGEHAGAAGDGVVDHQAFTAALLDFECLKR